MIRITEKLTHLLFGAGGECIAMPRGEHRTAVWEKSITAQQQFLRLLLVELGFELDKVWKETGVVPDMRYAMFVTGCDLLEYKGPFPLGQLATTARSLATR